MKVRGMITLTIVKKHRLRKVEFFRNLLFQGLGEAIAQGRRHSHNRKWVALKLFSREDIESRKGEVHSYRK